MSTLPVSGLGPSMGGSEAIRMAGFYYIAIEITFRSRAVVGSSLSRYGQMHDPGSYQIPFLMQRIFSTCFVLIVSLLVRAQLDVPWASLGGGTDQQVQALLRLSNGDLLVAGQFNIAGTTACDRVARWDGTTYSAMPGFPQQFEISCAAELNNAIYVGGMSTDPSSYPDLMKWDGSAWTGETVFAGLLPGVLALFVHDGVLHASGRFSGIAGNGSVVRRLNGTVWEQLGQLLNSAAHCLGYFNGHLVCGGSFTGRFLSTSNDIRHVAYLDGDTWTQLGDGLDGTVHDLLVHDNALYATGDMRSPTAPYFGLARIAPGATVWEPLMPNIGDYVRTPVSGTMSGRSMVEHNGEIYIGGEFLIGTATTLGRGLAVFHGAPDEVEAYCHFEGPVQAVEMINGHELVIGGKSGAYWNIASTNLLTTDIAGSTARSSFTVSPNPASGVVTVQLPEGMRYNAFIRVLDINGRLMREEGVVQGPGVSMDLSNEPTGTYIMEVRWEGQVHRERLVLMH